jgi:DNA-binding MarR family transcriptional regulator
MPSRSPLRKEFSMAVTARPDVRLEAIEVFAQVAPGLRRRMQAELPQDLQDDMCKITPHQGETLYLLAGGGERGVTMNELARRQQCALSTATAMVDRLIKLGLAARISDDSDRRVVRITVTETGAALTRQFAAAKRRAILKVLSALNDDEVRSLVQLMKKMAMDTEREEVAQ